MTWLTISGAGTTTATKFFGDVMNKLSDMLNGTDVSDTVTINANVTWTFNNGAFKLRNPADTFSYTVVPAAITANRNINIPLLTADDTIAVLGLSNIFTQDQIIRKTGTPTLKFETGSGEDYDIGRDVTGGFLTFTGKQTSFSGYRFKVNTTTNAFEIKNNQDVSIQPTKKFFLDNFGNTSMRESIPNVQTFEANGIDAVNINEKGIDINAGGIKLTTIKKTFESFLSGQQLDDNFRFIHVSGASAGTGAMLSGIDKGFQITTGASVFSRSAIDMNAIRHFDCASFTMYGIAITDANVNTDVWFGIGDTNDISIGTTRSVSCQLNKASFINLSSGDGTSVSTTASDVATSTSPVPFKIITDATNMRLFLLVSGVWTLKVTKTTNKPSSVATEVVLLVQTVDAANRKGDATYVRIQND